MISKLPTSITILGSTGSIGCNTLNVIRHLGGRDRFDIQAITGHSNIALLCEQAREFGVKFVASADEAKYQELKDGLSGTDIKCGAGATALIEAAQRESQWVMAAIVGMAGLEPTICAAERGANIALANKECLVSAGELFKAKIKQGGGMLLPVDSEHSAIFQVLDQNQHHALDKITLTASGGPYRTFTLDQMRDVTPESAADHPRWSMGIKISIDSASMFNKALEMIEAKHLFNVGADKIDVVVHPQSIVHSMVSYKDGSVLAQLGNPDMRTAIGYALSYPDRIELPVQPLDLVQLAQLDFAAPDEKRFPALRLARKAMQAGGLNGAILNGAKEVALEAFIKRQIGFLQMADIVETVMDDLSDDFKIADNMDNVFLADKAAREKAIEINKNLA